MMIFAATKANRCKGAIGLFAKLRICQMLRAVNQRQLDVLARGGARQQIKILEDEPYFAIPNVGEPVSIQAGNIGAVQNIMARSGPVETAQNIHYRGFTGTAR